VYEILGVSTTASQSEIRKAFYKKAKRCHPDKFSGDRDKEEEFKELNIAYENLSGAENIPKPESRTPPEDIFSFFRDWSSQFNPENDSNDYRTEEELQEIDAKQKSFNDACRHGDLTLVKKILSEDVKNLINIDRAESLHEAAKFGNLEVFEFLLTLKANIWKRDKIYKWTAFHYAAYNNKVNILEYIFNHSSAEDIEQIIATVTGKGFFKGNETLLHLAVRGKAVNALEFIIENKRFIDIDQADQRNLTALHHAVRKKYEICAFILLKHGAQLTANNYNPITFIDNENASPSTKKFINELNIAAKNPEGINLEAVKQDYSRHYCIIM